VNKIKYVLLKACQLAHVVYIFKRVCEFVFNIVPIAEGGALNTEARRTKNCSQIGSLHTQLH